MKVYARPKGSHYHMTKKCPMLKGKEFDRMDYKEITWSEVRERKLRPCSCVRETRVRTAIIDDEPLPNAVEDEDWD